MLLPAPCPSPLFPHPSRGFSYEMGNRHRAGGAYPARHEIEDLLGQQHRLRRRAQYPGERSRHRAARRAAGVEQGCSGMRNQVRPGDRGESQPHQRVRSQELLLSGSPQGLPDQPTGQAHRRRRRAQDRRGRCGKNRQPHPCPHGRGRRQVAARGLPRHDRHRPQPRRHAAAGDRLRAGNALQRRGRGLCPRAAHAGDLDRHLRRQHAGGQLPRRRQRLGAPGGPKGIRHPPRDQEPQLVQIPATGHRL